MRQVFIRELSYYSPTELSDKLKVPLESAKVLIEVLTTRGVLKLKSTNDVEEYDSCIDASPANRGKYQFVYVGIARFNDIVLVVYPKYFGAHEPTIAQMRQIFRVIRKASGSLSEIAAATEDGLRQNDKLALMLTILEMYSEYSLYSNQQKVYETNGYGDISWERTISTHDAFLNKGKPLYLDFETMKTTQDQSDFVTRFHEFAVTECSRFMNESGLAELLALDEVELTDSEIEDFGDKEYIKYRLEQELSIQFVTWKQDLIRLLLQYIEEGEVSIQSDDVMCLGITSFYHTWETACKIAFGDMLDKPLERLPITLPEKWVKKRQKTLLSIIPRPAWHVYDEEHGYTACAAKDTLIPDTVTIWGDNDDKQTFAILDAKYYTPQLSGKVAGVPGIESITKQHLYQSAYRNFVKDCAIEHVINAFVVPFNCKNIRLLGKVEFSEVLETLPAPFTNEILLWALPAEQIWNCYLENRMLGEEEINHLLGEHYER